MRYLPQKGDLAAVPFFCGVYLFLAYPLFTVLCLAFGNDTANGSGPSLYRFALLWQEPGLASACMHSLWIALASAVMTCLIAFIPAWTATHTRCPGRNVLHILTLLPLCMPSMLPAIGLIYLFGPQGCLPFAAGQNLYGPCGLIMGNVLFCIPHAALLLKSGLAGMNPELYHAATSLGAGPLRRFLTVTLPNARQGIASAFFVSFALSIADFGVPKVMAGNYAMLPTEIYARVIGQQDFTTGAVLSVVLLLPVCLVTLLNQLNVSVTRGNERSACKVFIPAANTLRDVASGLLAGFVALALLAVCGIVVFASFVSFWPYDLSLCLDNYAFASSGYSLKPFFTTLQLAFATACLGSGILFSGAWLFARGMVSQICARVYGFLLLLPLAVPGTVLGLAYIFAFNNSGVSGILYGTFFLIVANTIVHLSPAVHLASEAALHKLDGNLEMAGRVLAVPAGVTFAKVIVPSCRSQLVDIFLYLFINALTTVSAVVFLCTAHINLASVSVLQMHDSGNLGSAAAMGSLIAGTALAAASVTSLLHKITSRKGK